MLNNSHTHRAESTCHSPLWLCKTRWWDIKLLWLSGSAGNQEMGWCWGRRCRETHSALCAGQWKCIHLSHYWDHSVRQKHTASHVASLLHWGSTHKNQSLSIVLFYRHAAGHGGWGLGSCWFLSLFTNNLKNPGDVYFFPPLRMACLFCLITDKWCHYLPIDVISAFTSFTCKSDPKLSRVNIVFDDFFFLKEG